MSPLHCTNIICSLRVLADVLESAKTCMMKAFHISKPECGSRKVMENSQVLHESHWSSLMMIHIFQGRTDDRWHTGGFRVAKES